TAALSTPLWSFALCSSISDQKRGESGVEIAALQSRGRKRCPRRTPQPRCLNLRRRPSSPEDRLLADPKVYESYTKHLRDILAKAFTVAGVKRDLGLIQSVIAPIREKEGRTAGDRKDRKRSPPIADFSPETLCS